MEENSVGAVVCRGGRWDPPALLHSFNASWRWNGTISLLMNATSLFALSIKMQAIVPRLCSFFLVLHLFGGTNKSSPGKC